MKKLLIFLTVVIMTVFTIACDKSANDDNKTIDDVVSNNDEIKLPDATDNNTDENNNAQDTDDGGYTFTATTLFEKINKTSEEMNIELEGFDGVDEGKNFEMILDEEVTVIGMAPEGTITQLITSYTPKGDVDTSKFIDYATMLLTSVNDEITVDEVKDTLTKDLVSEDKLNTEQKLSKVGEWSYKYENTGNSYFIIIFK